MANTHGFFSKVDRSELDDEWKALLDVWYDRAYEDDNLFLTLVRRPGLLKAIYGFIAYGLGGKRQSLIDPQLSELCRIRMAHNAKCQH
ncbi:MAG: hypothetical protein ACYSUI_19975 [Planctomycetota bacterium]|jgi:hypothetical protein